MEDKFLLLVVVLIVILVLVLSFVLFWMWYKEKVKKTKTVGTNNARDEAEEKRAKKSLFDFMEFDTIEDNMIVQDGGKRYLMVIECKGVNYDLLSSVEKNSVEQGFIGFLNTLKFEIQLYIQTRKVNLAQSTMRYRERLKMIEMDMREEEQKYQDMVREGTASRDEILRELKEVTKKKNLYEYGKDIIENTEQMSEDSDLTTKEYYIVVPYYTDEITSAGEYDKREIGSMAFSELYTRAQSLVNTLTECDVRGKILTSRELVELLFISYNREQHDTYDFDAYMNSSGFDSFYSVTQDVLQKRMEALDEEIERKARDKALEAFSRVNKRTERLKKAIEDREKRMKEYINSLAEEGIEAQAGVLGERAVQEGKKELHQMIAEEELEGTNKSVEPNAVDEHQDAYEQYGDDITDDNVLESQSRKKEGKSQLLQFNDENNTDNSNQNTTEKRKRKLSDLTPEEREKRARILKKRKMLKEREAKKNGQI